VACKTQTLRHHLPRLLAPNISAVAVALALALARLRAGWRAVWWSRRAARRCHLLKILKTVSMQGKQSGELTFEKVDID